MKNKKISRILRVRKKDSGFTLLELLAGLIMSTIVIGAISFGLMQILRTTKGETSKIKVRSETSRALDFVSDEIKRAKSIESDASNATGFTESGTVVFALEIPDVNSRVVYYLDDPGSVWKGPQVLYRWGPPLSSTGEYTDVTDTTKWDEEALIDKIDDTVIASSPCTGTQTLTPAITSAAGFYACIDDNDGDATAGETEDSDGIGISAQLYFAGEVDAAGGYGTETYTANTQVVARARDDAARNDAIEEKSPDSVQTLSPSYACTDGSQWKMRTDFTSHSGTEPDDTTLNNSQFSWLRDPDNDDRQPQPFELGEGDYLTITSSPVGKTGCNRGRGNEYRKTKNEDGTYSFVDPQTPTTGKKSDSEALSDYEHKLQFQLDLGSWEQDNLETIGHPYYPTVKGVPSGTTPVVMIKKGDKLDTTNDSLLFKGYDPDGNSDTDTDGSQDSLAEFLFRKGLYNHPDPDQQVDYTDPDATFDPNTFEIVGLAPNERIIAVEIGQAYGTASPATNTGYDLQDNIFIFKSDKLKNSNIFSE
jgi:type II secretory pathway pseudopilin PulG